MILLQTKYGGNVSTLLTSFPWWKHCTVFAALNDVKQMAAVDPGHNKPLADKAIDS